MSNPQQPQSSDFSLRDVLEQINHRLGLIETDVREQRREFHSKFNFVIAILITTWLSMMGTLLFKLP